MSEVDEMSVEVVTVRDGRGHTHARVFVDGAEVPAVLYDIATPGAGWTPEAWSTQKVSGASAAAIAAAHAMYPPQTLPTTVARGA